MSGLPSSRSFGVCTELLTVEVESVSENDASQFEASGAPVHFETLYKIFCRCFCTEIYRNIWTSN